MSYVWYVYCLLCLLQAKLPTIYKNTRQRLLKTNEAVWFNKMCRIIRLKPNYINIKINGRKPQDKRTTTNAIRYRLNQEIKFLYCKKQNFNQQLYNIHLECVHHCNGIWQHIQNSIISQVNEVTLNTANSTHTIPMTFCHTTA
jgi:hypothetical protein